MRNARRVILPYSAHAPLLEADVSLVHILSQAAVLPLPRPPPTTQPFQNDAAPPRQPRVQTPTDSAVPSEARGPVSAASDATGESLSSTVPGTAPAGTLLVLQGATAVVALQPTHSQGLHWDHPEAKDALGNPLHARMRRAATLLRSSPLSRHTVANVTHGQQLGRILSHINSWTEAQPLSGADSAQQSLFDEAMTSISQLSQCSFQSSEALPSAAEHRAFFLTEFDTGCACDVAGGWTPSPDDWEPRMTTSLDNNEPAPFVDKWPCSDW